MKIYNKYKIEHTDGTPLKGKKYFVLRLDSDAPIEAARVARAMRAYEGKLRNCDVGTPREQGERFKVFCGRKGENFGVAAYCAYECPCGNKGDCKFAWAQMPYEHDAEKEGDAK